jgi:hypothetical protein
MVMNKSEARVETSANMQYCRKMKIVIHSALVGQEARTERPRHALAEVQNAQNTQPAAARRNGHE